jgi:hypothetical protein
MPLHLRKRGSVYHARGTVRVGREAQDVTRALTQRRSRQPKRRGSGKTSSTAMPDGRDAPQC